ncbi:hypothetical protein BDZ89DRAFT_1058679 [Hymenopellis radicata]|nr:hypothetical protein BDZ89DRAFT_1058679 [Hymenopellis radicata]
MPSDAVNDTSLGSQPDLSLGSLDSNFSPPRLPSNFNSNASINVLSTPTYGSDTPSRPKRGKSGKGALTLRDQEKHIDHLKKENFDIKIKCHFLEERLAQLAPDQMDAALKQNIDLKIELSARGQEIKRLKKLLLELERELERLQRGTGGSRSRERELEDKLREREMELKDLRRRQQNGSVNDERAMELEEQLEEARELLVENNGEIERLRDMIEQGDSGGDYALRKRVAELEDANKQWQDRMFEMTEDHEEEKGELMDSIESLGLKIEQLQDRNAAELQERSQSRAMILDEREHREQVEDDLNDTKDKLAAALIELQQKEDEVDVKNDELDNLLAQHDQIVEQWRGEVEEARQQVEELRDVIAERDTESKDLRLTISELERNTEDLHSKFEVALAHLEHEGEEKESEIDALTDAVKELGEQIYNLEDERDRVREEHRRQREDDAAERERLEAISAALKEKVAALKDELEEVTEAYETCSQEIHAHRSRQEELAQHVENLVEELEQERDARARAESALDDAENKYDSDLRRERRALEAKESALQSTLADLTRTQSLLSQREADLQAVQNVLQTIEAESKRAGETHTTARFSLQLEVDRLKRDLERLEDELARARKDLQERESKGRDRDGDLDKLHADNRDLTTQLAAQTQARLNLSEKLDTVQGSLKAAEAEVASFKTRVSELEARLGKDQRSLLNAESQYRDQLTERNTLLLTIYQYMDKILGVDKTPKTRGAAETKPFTNFSVFHDNLISRLKSLSQIQLEFDKRVKETEGRYTEKLNDMRKQLDMRWKQIDKFEASVKQYAEVKQTWRRKFNSKEGELEAIKTTNAEMAAQLAGMKRPGQTDSMELRSLSTRAVNAERRLNNAQNQLLATEEKLAQLSQRSTAADSKWEARVKEYESRLKAAEERVKKERQGAKDRVSELENSVKLLQKQLDLTQKRSHQLNDVIDANRVGGSPGSNSSR